MKKGDRVTVTCAGRTVPAEVALISSNGKSLVLTFDAMLDGHVGTMPVLRDDEGIYRALVTGSELTIDDA